MSKSSREFDNLLALKHSVVALCKFHVPALSLFHLSDDLNDGQTRPTKPVQTRGFAGLQTRSEEKLNKISSISSSSICMRSLSNHPWFMGGENVDFSKWIEELEKRNEKQELDADGLEHNNPFTI